MGILTLEIVLCILLNQLLKNKLNKKIRYAICIALLLNCWNMRTYQAMWAIHTLFCLFVLLFLFKKRKPIICILLSASISTSIVTFGYVNMYTIHKTTYNITTTKEITKNNIAILNDQEVHLNNIILIERSDYTNKNRKKTKDYNLTNKTYNIVLDHQPQGTKENIKNNVDLQLSGHTHNGQMFPLSYSYHLQPDFAGNYGKETFKHHTKIISSGLVGWGFPIRTEGICEYMVVNIKQDK